MVCCDQRTVRVVYLYIPTSNHNWTPDKVFSYQLYIFIFLHQTTTSYTFYYLVTRCISLYSYIKPQQYGKNTQRPHCCISLYSYIKPQLHYFTHHYFKVVYLYIPTSNHNSRLYQTLTRGLYIFIFLHQTTTGCRTISTPYCCISLYSYIKPQLSLFFIFLFCVVYLYIPTSNHNNLLYKDKKKTLYIFIFLHQTTTDDGEVKRASLLYIFIFLHQTTTT